MDSRPRSARERSDEEAVTVLVVDDSPAYLGALRDVVEATSGFVLVGEARTGEQAVELAALVEPDLVLMDVRLPGLGGIEAGAQIAASGSQSVILLLSSADEGAMPRRSAAVAAAILDKRKLSARALVELWSAHRPGAGEAA
jgi:DNA-binding NarL/FixJ family response regulator